MALSEDDLHRRAGRESHAVEAVISELVQALDLSPGFEALGGAEQDVLRAGYRTELEVRITHHPFADIDGANGPTIFRNPVYREFYLARLIASDNVRDWSVLTEADDASHYLALFFLSCIETRDLAEHEGFLFHFISLLATSSSGDDFLFRLEWNAGSQKWDGAVDAPYLRVEPFVFGAQVLSISLPLRQVLQNVALLGGHDCMVEIRGPSNGPSHADPIVLRDCFVSTHDIELNALALRFDGVTFEVDSLTLNSRTALIEGLDSLSVQPLSSAPVQLMMSDYGRGRWLTQFEKALAMEGGGESLFRLKLNKILLWFRRHRREEYGCYDKKFQTCALNGKRDGAAVALAEFLFAEGFLSRDGSLVVLNQQAFASYDISYAKQNALTFGARSGQLYARFADSQFGIAFA